MKIGTMDSGASFCSHNLRREAPESQPLRLPTRGTQTCRCRSGRPQSRACPEIFLTERGDVDLRLEEQSGEGVGQTDRVDCRPQSLLSYNLKHPSPAHHDVLVLGAFRSKEHRKTMKVRRNTLRISRGGTLYFGALAANEAVSLSELHYLHFLSRLSGSRFRSRTKLNQGVHCPSRSPSIS